MASTLLALFSRKPGKGGYNKLNPISGQGTVNYMLTVGFDSPFGQDQNFVDFRITGVDTNNNPLHLADAISLVVTSSNTAVLQLRSKPNVDQFRVQIMSPGSATLTIVVTYANGTAGPNTITVPCTIIGSLGSEMPLGIGNITTV